MKQKIKHSAGEKIFTVINYGFMLGMMFIMVYPLWYVVISSFSDPRLLMAADGMFFLPKGFSMEAYRLMINNPMILRGYGNTLFILVVGVLLNMTLTSLGAFFLSRKHVLFGKAISLMIIFTMYFSGGMIPMYLVVKGLRLENTLFSLIFPVTVNTFNLIILRTSFASIPESLEESAKLDGAGYFTIFVRIVLPLAKASLAVIVLYYAVAHWNSWFHAMLYLNDREKFPLQLVLREILINNDTSAMTTMISTGDSGFVGETIKYAVIVVSAVPILCVYPFVQKYFVTGVMVGAVKG